MRGRLLDVRAIGRAAGYVLVAATVIAAAMHFQGRSLPPPLATSPSASRADPLATALARCQTLGMAAENHNACQAAWTRNRRRFFSASPAPEAR